VNIGDGHSGRRSKLLPRPGSILGKNDDSTKQLNALLEPPKRVPLLS
jgi:hypothetical protein